MSFVTVRARAHRIARLAARAVALVLLVAVTACDGGPAGPGTLELEVAAPIQLGAAQLRVSGAGITGVHGLGTTEVVSRETSGSDDPEDSYRIVAFAPDGAPIRIGVEVESTDADLEAAALDAAGLDGIRVGVAAVEVRVRR